MLQYIYANNKRALLAPAESRFLQKSKWNTFDDWITPPHISDASRNYLV